MERSISPVAACSTSKYRTGFLLAGILFLTLALSACGGPGSNSKNQALAELAEIEFEEEVYDFGTVEPKGKVSYNFQFTNTSDNPLIISKAKAGCGCTVPSYPTKPVEPGESAEISVIYTASNAPGDVIKTVEVIANTYPAKTILTIKGTIKP